MSIKVTNWVWEHSEARGGARLVLLALADRADEYGRSWPSVQYLAARCRLSPRAVQRAVAELASIGELEIDHGGGRHRSNRYRIIPKPRQIGGVTGEKPRQDDAVTPAETPSSCPETLSFATETPSSATRNPVRMTPDPSIDTSTEPSEIQQQTRARETLPGVLTPAPADDLPEWLVPLADALSIAGINLPWKFIGDDQARLHNDILRLGIPLMVDVAVKAVANASPPPFSSRFLYDPWHRTRAPAIPPAAGPGGTVVALRQNTTLTRQQQAEADQNARWLARAQARDAQESS